ncbi:MAG: SUMF1/EgtB/PvdO family nonheme iron enzyme [Candidatus Omnitrophica bacterium]|nr:SUMF1/EgtB/PvdO family nonheme iron enzyme [Candidatus Omnitrophota bacterium]
MARNVALCIIFSIGIANLCQAGSPNEPKGFELPDLVPFGVTIETETPAGCLSELTPLGSRIYILNDSPAPAGPFSVDANGSVVRFDEGLPGNQIASMWTPGYSFNPNKVTVDFLNEVEESNEENNSAELIVPIPTPLPTCSPTPTRIEADIKPDGFVDDLDLFLFSVDWQLTTGASKGLDGDINGDRGADAHDLLVILAEWKVGVRPTPTFTFSPTSTSSPTHTFTPTDSPTPTVTDAPTNTFTPTRTPFPTSTLPFEIEQITIDIPGLESGARPMRLNLIPPGSFSMGSLGSERSSYGDERPRHAVTIAYDFYFGETEVTQAQWMALMGNNPATGLTSPPVGIGPNHPIFYITWNEAQEFIGKLNDLGVGTFRMPSEAEWEYACRGGTQTRFFFGDSLDCDDLAEDCAAGVSPGLRSDYMWYDWSGTIDGEWAGAREVASLNRNPFGLYDIHGNVREHCQDEYVENYIGAPTDGSPRENSGSDRRSSRDGYWMNPARACRSAVRSGFQPVLRDGHTGLRVVMVASPNNPSVIKKRNQEPETNRSSEDPRSNRMGVSYGP